MALLRGLPKELRRELVPIPDAADRFLRDACRSPGAGTCSISSRRSSTAETGKAHRRRARCAAVTLPPCASAQSARARQPRARVARRGRDLEVLRAGPAYCGSRCRRAPTPGGAWERDGVRRWDFGDVPSRISASVTAGVTLRMYPGDRGRGRSVRLQAVSGRERGRRYLTRDGVVRLAALAMPQQHDLVRRLCANDREFTLLAATAGLGSALFDEIADRAVADSLAVAGGKEPRTRASSMRSWTAGRAARRRLRRGDRSDRARSVLLAAEGRSCAPMGWADRRAFRARQRES